MDTEAKKTSINRTQAVALGAAGLAVIVAIVLGVAMSGSSSDAKKLQANTDFGFPNGDAANTRFAGGAIRASSVGNLKLAWTVPASVYKSGSYASSPIVIDDVVYSQDLASDVQAIDLETGKLLWESSYSSVSSGPNGIFVAGGRIYGATTTHAFALDRESGKEIWATELTRSSAEKVDMAPGFHNGLVYVSTRATLSEGGGVGTLWALDGKTGKKVWSFNTVPKGLWGNPKVNSGGGLSYTPAFDDDGSMYVGVEGPGPTPGTKQYPWGTSRPGPNLYTNSIVKLDAETGKRLWHYQLTPHSVCNWGLQGPAILIKTGHKDLVIAAGTAGIVIALDQRTGKLVWKRPVGRHNGHENDGRYAMRGEYSRLKTPLVAYPGALGGVAAAPSTNGSAIFVPVVNYGTALLNQTSGALVGSAGGELVALDTATGAILWKRSFPAGGYAATTTVNDVVISAFGPRIYAFASDDGDELWSASLPASVKGGVTASEDMLIVPASFEGTPGIAAYRLSSTQ